MAMSSAEPQKTLEVSEPTLDTCAGKGAFGAQWAATSPARTVLIVDDDEAVRELVAAVLGYRGCRVYAAANGLEGLLTLQQQRVDLLITDLQMPLLDGRRLARRARHIRPHLPILLISGGSAAAGGKRSALGGRCPLLRKPFSFAVFVDLVEDLLTRSRAAARFHIAAG